MPLKVPARTAKSPPLKKRCSACGKERAASKFRSDKRTTDGLASTCFSCSARGMSADGELATVDIEGVDILAEGGPYFGSGSPEEGDHFDAEYLQRLADDTNALMQAGELRSPNKIGHSNEQKLAKNSGLVAEDEMPAVGWLDNLRVESVDGVQKLVADIRKVPKKLAALIKSGAFRTRSVEISRLTAQTDKKKYEVISGLAWLGAKAPAVRTLNDIVALYMEGKSPTAAELLLADEDGDVAVYVTGHEFSDQEIAAMIVDTFAAGDLVWNPTDGVNALMSKLRAALADKYPAKGDFSVSSDYWITDVARNGRQAIVEQYSTGETWVVAFSVNDDGDVEVADKSEWTLAQQAWVEASKTMRDEMTADATVSRGMDDTSTMPKNAAEKFAELSDEQVEQLAGALGIEDVDPSELRSAVFARFTDDEPNPDGDGDGDEGAGDPPAPSVQPTPATTMSEADIAALKLGAAAGERAERKLFERERDDVITRAMSEGKISPADKDEWVGFYEKDAAHTTALLDKLPVNDEWKQVYGRDENGMTADDQQSQEDEAYVAYLQRQGVDTSNVLSLQGGKS